jgi:FAD/FMN-containing dehydrogenase
MGKLFSANPARMGRFDGPPTSDAVPASLVDGTPGDLKADLIGLLGKANVLHRAIDLVRYASDASPYRLVPQVVVLPRTTDDIVKLFRYCRETGRHATFRAAGTLGFIAEAVLETIPTPRVTSVAWIPFPTIDEAIALVPGLVALGASAVELMVAPALTAAGQAFAETPSYWKTLDPKAAALLVEIGAEDSDLLEATQHRVIELVSGARLIKPVEFTSVAEAIELAWHVREGLLGLVGKNRPEGSTLITEDVCFPPERLAQGAHDVQELLAKHGFIPGVAGHAAHGNLHFTLVANLTGADGLSRYSADRVRGSRGRKI